MEKNPSNIHILNESKLKSVRDCTSIVFFSKVVTCLYLCFRKTVVVGSGYIAVELAGIMKALGSDVTLVIRYGKVLRSFDCMLSDELMEDMADAGIKIARFSKV